MPQGDTGVDALVGTLPKRPGQRHTGRQGPEDAAAFGVCCWQPVDCSAADLGGYYRFFETSILTLIDYVC